MVVYNVYGLVYFLGDVYMFGSLDNILVFFFENFFLKLKRMIRKLKFLLV